MSSPTDPKTVLPLDPLDAGELNRVLEESTEGTWIYEPDSDRVGWSPRVFALLGYDEQSARLEDIHAIIHPDDRDGHRAAVERVLAEGGQYRIALRVRTQDGGYKGVRAHGMLLPANARSGRRLVGFLLDATSEIEVKQSLARSEAQFRSFMDSCPAAVFLKDENGTHLYVNETTARIAGVTVAEMIGRTNSEIFSPAVAKALSEADADARATSTPITKLERIVDADGETHHVLDTKFPVHGVGSDSTLVGGFGLDISDRVRQEEEIRELDRHVQASQRLESIGLLAGGVAHDFNNVLMTVMGNAELAMEAEDSELRREFLQTALERCRHAAALCSQLLTYAGKSPGSPQSMQPAEMIQNAGELFDLSRSAGVHITTQIEADLPDIRADEVQVRQVLMNLITNAVDAVSGRGDGRIQLECCRWVAREGHAVAHSWAESEEIEWVAFVVTDNGVGMDSEQLQRMFEPFYTTKEGGRGLGMPTVMGIMKAHGGAISVDSTVGRGSEVAVGFPIAARAQPVPRARPSKDGEALDLTSWRVLVVDDQPEVLAVASGFVERLGATVRSATSGEDALEAIAAEGAFDLAVIDVTMPGMSGIELARRIRVSHPAMGIVLTSGYAEEQCHVSGPQVVFLRKPYRLVALEAALRSAMVAPPPS